MVADFLSEHEWQELLLEIHNRQVIPVIGPELVLVPEVPGADLVPLQRWLAVRLAARLELPPNGAPWDSLNRVACQYLLAGNSRKAIYTRVSELLDSLDVPPPEALRELAAVTDFDLFLTGTADSLFSSALETCRPAFRRKEHVLAYDFRRPVDLPEKLGETVVYHLLGSRETHPNFAVWEEDYLEFICGLIQHRDHLARLFLTLKSRYLLLLGAPFSDWIVRFFLFVAKGGRFSDRRRDDFGATVIDHPENFDEPMIFFFDKVVGTARVIPGDPAMFVASLARRWREQYGGAAASRDPLARIPDAMPRGAVFVSYSRDDFPAVTNLVRGLAAAGIPVWLDKQRLEAGENYEHSLERAVRVGCSFFLSVISRATESDPDRFVHRERRWAAQRHVDGYIFYLPIVIDDTAVPRLEPPAFSRIHFEHLPAGQVSPAFASRLAKLVEEWRLSGQPRA